ncbi:MAG: cell division protein FtsA [bacterium]|nr:cell division protein FtsA [bacterium]
MKDTIITGLDIGSTSIRAVVGQMFSDGGEKKLQIIGAAEHPSEGVSRGTIASLDSAIGAITACLEKAERMTGIPVDAAWVGISGTHIVSQASKGVVAIGRVNGEISRQDVERAVEAARAIATPANYEILHVIPRGAVIDGQIAIKDPIGMTGTRLEMDTLIIQGFASEIRNFTKCIYRTGMEIDDLVFSILATADAVLSNKQKDLGTILVNIGGATTSIIVFEEGEVLHTVILPVGADHITCDIAIGLRVSIDVAEKIKRDYGSLSPLTEGGKKADVNLSDFDSLEDGTISLKYVSHIIEARVEEIFEKIHLELKKIGRDGMLPGGVVLTGGGSKLHGMVDTAKKRLKLPASIATVRNVVNPIEKVFDQSFTTAVSLCYWGLSSIQQKQKHQNFPFKMDTSFDAKGRVKKWFKSLLP